MALFRRSLLLRFLLPIITVVTALVLVATWLVSEQSARVSESSLHERAKSTALLLASAAAGHLWNMEDRGAAQVLQQMVEDPDFLGAVIKTDRGQVFAKHGTVDPDPGAAVSVERPSVRVENGVTQTVGSVVLHLSRARAQAEIKLAQRSALGFGLGTLALVVLLLGVLVYRVTRPITKMTEAMKTLADGLHDIEVPALDRKDEIGAMAHAVEVFRANAIEIERLEMDRVRADVEHQRKHAETVARLMKNFEESVSTFVTRVTHSGAELRKQADQVSDQMRHAESGSTQVTTATGTASANVQTVAAATTELSSSITEIGRQVTESANISARAHERARISSDTVGTLAIEAQRIGDVVRLINEIAAQTNLLALNATIEAARAGEAGRGFAVVASEVKTLAAQTAKATDEIASQVAAIQATSERVVNEISQIVEIVERSRSIASGIAAAVEEQEAATREIARSIDEAAVGTERVARGIDMVSQNVVDAERSAAKMSGAARGLNDDVDQLRAQVDQFLSALRAA